MSQVGIEYKQPRIFSVGPVRFLPGNNLISSDEWELIKDHPELKSLFKSKDFTFIEGKEPGKAGHAVSDEAENPLLGMSVSEAKEFVAKTLDINLLEKMKAAESRKSLLDAIDKQVAKLMPTDEEKAAKK